MKLPYRFDTWDDFKRLVDDGASHDDDDISTGGKRKTMTTQTAERFTFSLDKAARAKVAAGKLEFTAEQVEKLKTFARDFMKRSCSIAGNGARFTVARTLHDGASKQLHDEAKALEFASHGKSYMECRNEIRRRRPELDWFLAGVPVPDDEADVTLDALED